MIEMIEWASRLMIRARFSLILSVKIDLSTSITNNVIVEDGRFFKEGKITFFCVQISRVLLDLG